MTMKVKLKINGEVRTHYTSPISPEHTLCGDQWVEDDGDTVVIGDAPYNARITCEPCRELVEYCKAI